MPDIQGTDRIILQPTEQVVPYTFTFPICTAADANDGAIPYGDTIASCTVKAYDSGGVDVTTEIVNSSSLAGNVVTVELDYPTSSGAGSYKLTFQITTANGAHLEFDFGGTYATNRFKALDL